ncbi:MAG: molybdopterin molybdotransferase MoeA [bacterium]|nr:molybdopterin molybdotransferase MoeA [bacterium]
MMIEVEEALMIILNHIRVLDAEKVDILDSLDRILAEEIYSEIDIPPFRSSAMDGYAVVAADTVGALAGNPVYLEVIDDIPAGSLPKRPLSCGQAARIMTGAPLPAGADAVIMVEYTERDDGQVKLFREVSPLENIREAGEDVAEGDLVLPEGTIIRPAEVGMLASLGKRAVSCIRKPRVAILSTGDEVVDIDQELSPGKIRNSNGYSLYAQVVRYGGIPVPLGIAPDDEGKIKSCIEQGLSSSDMLVISGGVSVGDYDLVKGVLADLGAEMKFWKVAMKPGKPLAFGLIKGKPVFGLPGYPVSVLVVFEQFVRPAMRKMAGRKWLKKPEIEAELCEEIKKKPDRRNYFRGIVDKKDGQYYARTTGPQGSGMLSSMVKANALLIIPEGVSYLKAGEKVKAQMLDYPEVE